MPANRDAPLNLNASRDISAPLRVGFSRRTLMTLAVAAALLIYNLAPLAFGTDAILARVPDDAFYYLVLAKNFVAKGFWTFDGTHAATGFHLLYGYLLAGMYAIAPDLPFIPAYVFLVIVNVALIGSGLYMLLGAVSHTGLEKGMTGVLLVALSPASFRMAGYPMESALVMFFGSAAVLLATPAAAAMRFAPILAFAIGLAGVLARSDLGALPFALFAGALGLMIFKRAFDNRALVVLGAMCAGAIFGELIVMAHTYYFTGGFVQRSASIKLHWAKASGYTAFPGIARIAELMGPVFVPRPLILLAIAGAAVFALMKRGVADTLGRPLVPAAILICAGYVAVYAVNGAVQYWYAANFFAAAAILAAVLWASLAPDRAYVKWAAIALFLASAVYQQMTPPWPWQKGSREAGQYLKAHPEISPVGSWNAGITGYFAERPVVNLDGLVNDDVYSYVSGGKFVQYLRDRQIAYVVDFTSMMDESAGRRGGYSGSALSACLKPLKTFAPDERLNGGVYSLMQADHVCLHKAPW